MSLWAAAAVITLATCALLIMLARRLFLVVTVVGVSMVPALEPGDRVLVRRNCRAPVHVGDILMFRDPHGQQAVKRVAALVGDLVPDSVRPVTGGIEVVPPGMLVLLGDGVRSGDSREWGFIPASHTVGPVIRKLSG
jgi:signal peptidase I